MRKHWVALLIMAVLTAALAASPPPTTAQPRVIKIGIVDTFSGPPAVFGNDALNGFKLRPLLPDRHPSHDR